MTEREKHNLDALYDHLVRVAEGSDNPAYRYMEFVLDPVAPRDPMGWWWLDVFIGESRAKAQHWSIQWRRGMQGFGVSHVTEEVTFQYNPSEVLPDADAVVRKLGFT